MNNDAALKGTHFLVEGSPYHQSGYLVTKHVETIGYTTVGIRVEKDVPLGCS